MTKDHEYVARFNAGHSVALRGDTLGEARTALEAVLRRRGGRVVEVVAGGGAATVTVEVEPTDFCTVRIETTPPKENSKCKKTPK